MKTTIRYMVQYFDSWESCWESDNASFDSLEKARNYLKQRDIEVCGKRDKFRIVKKTTTLEVIN